MLEGAVPSPGFLGDLDDPWVLEIAEALPPETVRIPCVGDLPDPWPDGLKSSRDLVLHRSILSQADFPRIRALRAGDGGPGRIVVAVGPNVRARELERLVPLVDAILPEATARETIGRHLGTSEVRPRPGGSRPTVAIVSANFEWRRTLADAAEAAGYPARPSAAWPESVEAPLAVWDVPVLEPIWSATLKRESRGRSIVALIGFADRETVGRARAAGASACLDLLADPDDLRFVLDRLADRLAPPARFPGRSRIDGPADPVPPVPAHARARTSVRSVAGGRLDA